MDEHRFTIIDTHAHLMSEAFDEDRAAIAAGLPGKGVSAMIEIACDPRDFAAAAELAEGHGHIYLSFGIHPEYALSYTALDLEELAIYLAHPKAVALGEIGLDYHYEPVDRPAQKALFEAQLIMARRLDMPVSLHVRDAYGDCLEILRRYREGLRGVMHCFSGSAEVARECVEMGLYIAFGGALTFSNNRRGVEAAAAAPPERLLLETDCPYMAPTPHRGERCTPDMAALTLARMAEIKGLPIEQMAEITSRNAGNLFGIPIK